MVIAPPEIAPADDDREMFVAAWCKLIPAEKNIFIPEPPGEALIPGEALYIQADDVVLNRLPGLRYLVRMRVVEIQDWRRTPPFGVMTLPMTTLMIATTTGAILELMALPCCVT